MIAALTSRPKTVDFRGEQIRLRRPTVADLIALADASERGQHIPAWYVLNHVMDGDAPAFSSMDEVMRLDGPAVLALSREIDKLYGEGLD